MLNLNSKPISRFPSGGMMQLMPLSIPVPRTDELLTKEQAISLIKTHASLTIPEDSVWLNNTTMFTILEGDSNRGRAIVGTPFLTALALEQYDLFNEKIALPRFRGNLNVTDSGNEVRVPTELIEFSYDYSLTEEEGRFCMIRHVKECFYLICGRELPKEWIRQMSGLHHCISNTTPSLDMAQICGDPVPESDRRFFPKSHMVHFYDDKKLFLQRTRRNLAGLLKLAEYKEGGISMTLPSVLAFDWDSISMLDFNHVLGLLPRVLREAVGTTGTPGTTAMNTACSIVYACFQDNSFPTNQTKRALVYPKNWKKFCAVIETLEELYGENEDISSRILNYLLTYLGSLDSRGKQVPKDIVISYIRAYIERCGIDENSLKSEALFRILYETNDDPGGNPEFFSKTSMPISNDPNFRAPVVRGYTEFFGLSGSLMLDQNWYIALTNRYRNDGIQTPPRPGTPFDITDEKVKNDIRNRIRNLLDMANSFTIDQKQLRCGVRLEFAKTLIAMGSEELVSRSLKQNLTTIADIKRALKYVVKNGINSSLLPFLVYVSKKGA